MGDLTIRKACEEVRRCCAMAEISGKRGAQVFVTRQMGERTLGALTMSCDWDLYRVLWAESIDSTTGVRALPRVEC
jgi:hypothetical protein